MMCVNKNGGGKMSQFIIHVYITLDSNNPHPLHEQAFSVSFVEKALELNDNLGNFSFSWKESGERACSSIAAPQGHC